jgi:hypothetical protein
MVAQRVCKAVHLVRVVLMDVDEGRELVDLHRPRCAVLHRLTRGVAIGELAFVREALPVNHDRDHAGDDRARERDCDRHQIRGHPPTIMRRLPGGRSSTGPQQRASEHRDGGGQDCSRGSGNGDHFGRPVGEGMTAGVLELVNCDTGEHDEREDRQGCDYAKR